MTRPPDLPDLGTLDLLVSAAELGSISQAAARRQLSQPAASMRLAALERRFGFRLLDRTPTGCTPTPRGEAVVAWAADLLAEARQFAAAVDTLRGDDGRFAVAASLTIAEQLLPTWLNLARRRQPSTHVTVTVINSNEVIDLVRRAVADLGFVESNDPLHGLHSAVVGHDRLVVAIAADHPWRRRRQPLEPHHLAAAAMIGREPGSGTRSTYEQALAATGHTPPPLALELSSTAAIRTAVAAGLGPTVISELAIADDIAAGRLTTVPTTGIDLDRQFRAVWRGRAPHMLDVLVPKSDRVGRTAQPPPRGRG